MPAAVVKAFLNPARLEAVLHMLARFGVGEVLVAGAVGLEEEGEGEMQARERVAVEFRVAGEMAEEVLAALLSAARTGRRGNDGKVFVLEEGGGE